MAIYKIRLNFTKLSYSGLATFTFSVITVLSASLIYTTPNPTILQLTAIYDAFMAAIAAASDGGKSKNLTKNQKKAELIAALRILVNYIEGVAANDPAKLSVSGFEYYSGSKTTLPIPGRGMNLSVDYGKLSGTADAKLDSDPYAIMYQFRYTYDDLTPESVWIILSNTLSPSITITGLTLGRNIWVQARCVNGQGEGDWSDPAQLIFIH